ncbi:MAG TPA: hypothetical protein VFI49_15155 [Rudaea sp.]|nr:hypothetical protein [Rudaea sp.]
MAPEPLQPSRMNHSATWRLHRFTRAGAADSARGVGEDVRVFFGAVIEHFAGEGCWMQATAPARGGGVDVWFRLPVAPADADFRLVWSRLLASSGLASQAISGRN